jgi:hypothetical protein
VAAAPLNPRVGQHSHAFEQEPADCVGFEQSDRLGLGVVVGIADAAD